MKKPIKRHVCPNCAGPMSDYMRKKEGACWSCIKWDSRGGAYRVRFNHRVRGVLPRLTKQGSNP